MTTSRKLYVADRETGTFIEEVKDIPEGLSMINFYEQCDRNDGTYTPDFYDLVDEDHGSVLLQ